MVASSPSHQERQQCDMQKGPGPSSQGNVMSGWHATGLSHDGDMQGWHRAMWIDGSTARDRHNKHVAIV